jgi:hypothetical protein
MIQKATYFVSNYFIQMLNGVLVIALSYPIPSKPSKGVVALWHKAPSFGKMCFYHK